MVNDSNDTSHPAPDPSPSLPKEEKTSAQNAQIPAFTFPQVTYTVLPTGEVQITMTTIAPSQVIQGLPVGYPQNTAQYGYFPPQPFSHMPPVPMPAQSDIDSDTDLDKRTLPIAVAISHFVGLVTVLPHLASLIMSFVILNRGYFRSTAKEAYVFISTLVELVFFTLGASLSWLSIKDCHQYSKGGIWWAVYESDEYIPCENGQKTYYGYIFIAAWIATAVLFGVPRAIITLTSARKPNFPVEQKRSKIVKATLITSALGLFTFIPYFTSLVTSFHMLHRRYFKSIAVNAYVLSATVAELILWVACAATAWIFTKSDYAKIGNYYDTRITYYGWIPIAIWFGMSLCLGIPRMYFTWKYAQAPDVLYNNKDKF